ncbi:MAG TPA: ComF family protein [Steroidobacteraceae bacterium]
MFEASESIVNRAGHLRLTIARRWSRVLAATVFPPECCLCGFPGASLDLDLCGVCRDDLPWLRNSWCAERSSALVAFNYAQPVDDLIRDLKYRGLTPNARVLGVLLAQAVVERASTLPRLLVPVPLHDRRLRERGFNQAASLARYAGRMLGIPFAARAVRRVRDTPSQTSLTEEERHRNVRAAFAIAGPRHQKRLSGAGHVAVVDDVMTTGSTLNEMKSVLVAAGVRQVDLWAVARVA